MNDLLNNLRKQFESEEARTAYAEGFVNAQIAAQIKLNRESREMSQQDLADAVGTQQSGISRLENVNYYSWKVESLRKLARAFGLWLDISFREFGDLHPRIESFNRETLVKRKFQDDPAFAEQAASSKAIDAYILETQGKMAKSIHSCLWSMFHSDLYVGSFQNSWFGVLQRESARRTHFASFFREDIQAAIAARNTIPIWALIANIAKTTTTAMNTTTTTTAGILAVSQPEQQSSDSAPASTRLVVIPRKKTKRGHGRRRKDSERAP